MMSGTLEIEDVFTAYDKADVLQGVSLKVEPGRITCLLGSNGSGKTTLVRSILGLTPSRLGRIVFDGADITRLPTHKIIAAGIACIPEGRKVFPKLTVEENLRVGAYQERSDKVSAARLDEILNIFPRLSERRTQLAGTMSGGEQAMVSIGRGLMSQDPGRCGSARTDWPSSGNSARCSTHRAVRSRTGRVRPRRNCRRPSLCG